MHALSDIRIVIADDDPADAAALEQLLEDAGYDDLLITQVDSLVALCEVSHPDLVIVGVDAAGLGRSGIAERLRELNSAPDRPPVLLAANEPGDEIRRAALAGASSDYLAKPVDPAQTLVRVRNLLEISRLRRTIAERRDVLDQAVRTRTLDVEQARLETLTILASVAEYHDDDTRQHAQRVGIFAALIARRLGLPEARVARIRQAAPLHDLGKIGISRRVLLKPGELTAPERENMMRHVEIGARILEPARSPVLRLAAEIARAHHEHWDGQGYLIGLAGEQIPLSGRITAVADVFDALTHDRPYRAAWDPDLALEEITTQSGCQFDPDVVAAFMSIERETLLHEVSDEAGDVPAGGEQAPVDGPVLPPTRPAVASAQA